MVDKSASDHHGAISQCDGMAGFMSYTYEKHISIRFRQSCSRMPVSFEILTVTGHDRDSACPHNVLTSENQAKSQVIVYLASM